MPRCIANRQASTIARLGVSVVIAEINKNGKAAAERINREMGRDTALFVQTDVGDGGSVKRLARRAAQRFGKVDIVLNNATVAP